MSAAEWGWDFTSPEVDARVDVCISSWNRVAPDTLPALSKGAANYFSSQLIGAQARRLGFAEAIGLNTDGNFFSGKTPDKWGWLNNVDMSAPRVAASA